MIDTNDLYNLDYIVRYSNVPRIKDETVASHSFFVAVEVYKLYKEFDFDINKAIHIALTHDFPECYIDDVNHKIKESYPKVAKALKEAESEIIKGFPEFIQHFIFEYEGKFTNESLIVHLADIIQCKTYSYNEIKLGNKGYMQKVYNESTQREKEFRVKLNHILRT